jgi:gas vesicle protein
VQSFSIAEAICFNSSSFDRAIAATITAEEESHHEGVIDMSAAKFLIGIGIGIGLGMIFAPAPGEETRRSIAQGIRDLAEIPARKIEEKAEEAAEAAKEKAGDLGSRIGRQAAEAAVETATDNLLKRKKGA